MKIDLNDKVTRFLVQDYVNQICNYQSKDELNFDIHKLIHTFDVVKMAEHLICETKPKLPLKLQKQILNAALLHDWGRCYEFKNGARLKNIDHFMPPTSCILHGKLGLRRDCFCLDVSQGCCGFVVGLLQAFQLLEQKGVRKVAVVNADVISRKVSPKDRNSYPLIGDAATIAIVENREGVGDVFADVRFDGTRSMALQIPAGAFRLPSSPETAVMSADAEGNERAPDNLVMDGTAVFNFVMADVPPMLSDLVKDAGLAFSGIDKYYFHQPNKFMLQKLAEKLDVPYGKMPNNVVENYGNSSGATIPSAMALNDAELLCREMKRVCFSGFGVGLTYGGIVMNCGRFDFCDTIYYPNKGE